MNLRRYLDARTANLRAELAAANDECREMRDRLAMHESMPAGRRIHLLHQQDAALCEWVGLMDGTLPPSEVYDVLDRTRRLRDEVRRPWPPKPSGSVVERASGVSDEQFRAANRPPRRKDDE